MHGYVFALYNLRALFFKKITQQILTLSGQSVALVFMEWKMKLIFASSRKKGRCVSYHAPCVSALEWVTASQYDFSFKTTRSQASLAKILKMKVFIGCTKLQL